MNKLALLKNTVALVFVGLCTSAFASNPVNVNTNTTIYGNTFSSGSSSVNYTFLGGVTATFSAWTGSLDSTLTAAKFSYKAQQGGIQGVGVSPKTGNDRTSGEIDIGEYVQGSFSSGVIVKNFSVGLLFNGPEYNDVNEKAKVTVLYADSTKATFTLTATGDHTAVWATSNGTTIANAVSELSPAISPMGGAWSVSNPFGNKLVSSIYFTSVTGSCGSVGGTCGNQTDFTFNSITAAVPEPETYAMLLAGLGLIGTIARRRKAKQA